MKSERIKVRTIAETQLYPRSDDWKLARLIKRDNAYVIQSRWNEKKKEYESETVIDIETTECPEIQAAICYFETAENAVLKKLYKRQNYLEWVEKNKVKEEETDESDE